MSEKEKSMPVSQIEPTEEMIQALGRIIEQCAWSRENVIKAWKRGSTYAMIGVGKMQAESWIDEARPAPVDMREVAIYRSTDDGSLWVRPREEFEDGRFEVLSATAKEGE